MPVGQARSGRRSAVASATCGTRSLSSGPRRPSRPPEVAQQKPGGCAVRRSLRCASDDGSRMTRTVTAVRIARPARTAERHEDDLKKDLNGVDDGPRDGRDDDDADECGDRGARTAAVVAGAAGWLAHQRPPPDRRAARTYLAGLDGQPGAVNVGHATYPFSGLSDADWVCVVAGPEECDSSWPGIPVRRSEPGSARSGSGCPAGAAGAEDVGQRQRCAVVGLVESFRPRHGPAARCPCCRRSRGTGHGALRWTFLIRCSASREPSSTRPVRW